MQMFPLKEEKNLSVQFEGEEQRKGERKEKKTRGIDSYTGQTKQKK